MLHRDGTIAVAEVGPVCVVVWRGGVTQDPFERQRAALAGVVQRHPEGAAFLCLVERTAKPPDDQLRRASSQMVKSHGEVLKCVACVIEGDGFIASINRSAVSGMVLLAGHKKSPVSVFARVPDAALWMRRHVEMGPADGFMTAVEHVRSQLISVSQNG